MNRQQHNELSTPRLSSKEKPWVSFPAIAERLASGVTANSDATERCSQCFDTGMKVTSDGAIRCECEVARLRQERLATALMAVPARYREARLMELQPRPDLHTSQAEIIDYMKANPAGNYFFCGHGDTGKTHFFWSLYDHLARADVRVFTSSLFDLVESIKQRIGRGEPSVQILPELERLDRVAVFLDDVNKARPTEFVAETVFNFVDRIYRHKHQLVVTSQLAPEDLIEHFERVDHSYGLPIVRRMVNDETAVWRMF